MENQTRTTHQLLQELAGLRQRVAELEAAETQHQAALRALRESEERYRGVFEGVQDAIFVETLSGEILDVNSRACEMFGYPRDVFLTRTVNDLVPPDHFALIPAEFPEPVVPAEPIETVNIRADGQRFPVEITGQIQTIGDESVLLVVVRDITERKQAEAIVRESEKRFRNLFDGVPACCWTFDREGNVLDWNRAAEELYGWPRDQVIGQSMYNLMVRAENAAATRDKIAAVFQGHSFHGLEYQDLRADGTSCHVLVNEYPVFDAQGEVVMGICAELDITERKRAEAERQRLFEGLREQVDLTHRIVDTVPDGVLLLDSDGRLVLANPAARDYLALLSPAEPGKPVTRIGDRTLAELLGPPPEPGRWHTVSAHTIPDRVFEVIVRPMEEGAGPGGVVMVIRDVTAERDFQRRIQQQERLAAVGQLAAGVAHDFNNIMASIVLYSDMMLRYSDPSPDDRKRLETIRQQCRAAADITQQIMDFSRTAVLQRQELDLIAFAEKMHALLGRTLPENIHLHLVHDHEEIVVQADPTRLQQALMNLAINARDAMPEGGHLHIALKRVQGGDGEPWARITVADSGVGIPADNLPHIFEPFFTTRAPLGSGLGLSQVYGIVKQHEGNITVESHVGTGTTFTIDLPALQSRVPREPVGEPESLAHGSGQTILVVEDNPAVRQALVDSLSALGYGTLEAENGQRALALYEQHETQIALVVSDLVMPEMGGQALLQALRKQNPRVRMVLLTGHPDRASVASSDSGGSVGWLGKPVDLESLARVVSQTLAAAG